jgi:NADPH:quinone reductase-like Zn-dependent oxidoreductase
MKALLSRDPGGPETLTLEDRPDPVPGPGQLLVRIASAALNYPDALMIEDRYQYKPPRPFSPGTEASGVVAALGEGVEGFSVGDRVFAVAGNSLAELAVVDAVKAFHMPDAMPFNEASTLLITYATTAHAFITRARLKAGETVLVLGAAGGTGVSAIQVAKALGAKVVAGVSSPAKADFVRQAGADDVIVYARAPFDAAAAKAFGAQLKAACPNGYDVIYDPVGGDYSEPALRAIAWGGRFLVIGFTAGIAKLPLNLPLLKMCDVLGVYWGEFFQRSPAAIREEVAQLLRLWSEGGIKPLITGTYPLERAPEAIARLNDRAAVGKLVVEVARL